MQTVIGIFDNVYDAQKAVQELKSNGFSNVDVSVKEGGAQSAANYEDDDKNATQNYSGTSAGTSDYSGTSAGTSDYSGTSAGTSNYPDTSAGTSDYANTSAGTTDYSGTSAGTSNYTADSSFDTDSRGNSGNHGRGTHDESFGDKVSKFFKNLFGDDDDEADRYSHVANKTGCVVTVHAQSEEESKRAADILDEYGAVDVNERAAQYGYSGGGSDVSSGVTGSNANESDKTLNVIKEDVQVGKREVETGGVRLRSRIVERPVEETLRLREEKITVERTPVDRAATTADFQNFKEGEIEMTERAEVAQVSKQARVVEEIKLSKEVNERTETVRETARDTEVDVENVNKKNTSAKTDLDTDL